MSYFMKIRPVTAEFYADRQTDRGTDGRADIILFGMLKTRQMNRVL